ncbi:MAG: bifunctional enoyl-CoA hydratase/phosphate acetyltransferase [Phyllobacteriaceae bacterium]|nr:bifunctional enoyl-CoA hydratase/phosphate acetyltransferase [Phyllobacteriaceae bacterium]
MIENKLWDEIRMGAGAATTRRVRPDDLFLFSRLSGHHNTLTLPAAALRADGRAAAETVPPFLVAAILSAVVGNRMPGPGTMWRTATITFLAAVVPGDELTASVTVTGKYPDGTVALAFKVAKANGEAVAEGHGVVAAPVARISLPHLDIPEVMVERHVAFDRLLEAAATRAPTPTAVVQPDDESSLTGAVEAWKAGLIEPILVGVPERIRRCAEKYGLDVATLAVEPVGDDDQAAARAVAMVHEGRVRSVMKGHLHTDVLLHHIVKKDGGLRTSRRLSHVFVLDVPGRPTPLLISDAAINIAPDLDAKVHIVQNAIDLARAIGITLPKVGVLSAVETVNPAIPSTIDAAVLSKMAERGQIRGGIVDGPLAMDNAIDADAAESKGIVSLVAGHADVLIAPNLESGNMLAKELVFLASAETSGLVIGAKVPVMVTSRADDRRARLASAALAQIYGHFLESGESLLAPTKTGDCP